MRNRHHAARCGDHRYVISRARGADEAGVRLINTARGEIASTRAVLEALASGHLAGFATDALVCDSRRDGIVAADPFTAEWLRAARAMRRLNITPHLGGHGAAMLSGTRAFTVQKFLKCCSEVRE